MLFYHQACLLHPMVEKTFLVHLRYPELLQAVSVPRLNLAGLAGCHSNTGKTCVRLSKTIKACAMLSIEWLLSKNKMLHV